ncbi:DUF1553 domain-containing protein [Fimbriimonas ginsengisoli]|uniref:LamG-like jellyroll fold domain-containing protein n=1 Tax=Fimbriimonas ginsengisoli Gsoil 348 TaxID=661478 RepID=A0A068NTN3_FIMGI|nr:DUF1553 domain-containing protein [Fimbriimonas ginsengisoli]AIE86095.1 hypothetical protein OP10G_2727 [Fimbriimonas ginsengisoli Gsoil 348]
MRTLSPSPRAFRALLQFGCVGLFVTGAWSTTLKASPKPIKKTIDFNRDVRPIITKCFTCHGHDPKQVAAGLRLDDGPSAKKPLKDGTIAIVPFHPEQSMLISRINAPPEMIMPPKSSNKILSAEEKQTLKQWILEGAEYKPHWGFVAATRPAVPTVKLKSWPKNPIDNFILAKMEEKGLKPSPEADKRTLIRRVTLDIAGLPPTPSEVDAFLKDTKPGAYERVVDRLLASPRYGERMAMDWMDYARYADSNGYQADWERFQWRWRDWVIDAFNKNMPYDRFTVEQIAGDMLPNATMEQKLATGFNRNHRINTEGGVVAEEWRVENVIDRVETTSAVWLGLTAGCARCHDHKYDPITQKDFYSLFAYFNNVPESGTGEERPVDHPPVMKAPTPEQSARMALLQGQVDKLNAKIAAQVEANSDKISDWKVAIPDSPALHEGLVGRYRLSNPLALTAGDAPAPKPGGKLTYDVGRCSGAANVGENAYVDLGSAGDFDSRDHFSYGGWIRPNRGGGSPISHMDMGHDYRGWDIFMNGDRPATHLIDSWPDNAFKVVSQVPIPMGKWSHVLVTYDGSMQPSGVRIYINGQAVPTMVEGAGKLTGTLKTPVSTKIGRRSDGDVFDGQVDDVVLYRRALSPDDAKSLADANPAIPLLAIPPDKRTKEQRTEIGRGWLLEHDPSFAQLAKQEDRAVMERNQLDSEISPVMVMEEMPKPRDAFVLQRGQYDHHGAKVTAAIPAALRIPGKTFANNRLGLAKWIVDPKNPLTGRVTVNRLWDRFFGAGIVPTVEDFGTRADFPTHPELLDWLATDFVSGWNLKKTIRQIVTSATYRQSSKVTAALMKVDPTNKYLARGPRFRMNAEVLRDQAMYVGGMLTEKLGGPSVRPYQPAGVWDDINVYGNLRNYRHDEGPNLHRRSLYTIWKRTAAPPTMTLFDVPTRETCRVRRARTDTPLQALTMLNDVTYVEASRALAIRMLREGGPTAESRLGFAFKVTLSRAPSAEEKQVLLAGLKRRLAHYRADRKAADEVMLQGDLLNDPWLDNADVAAYTILASTILNLDETVTRE